MKLNFGKKRKINTTENKKSSWWQENIPVFAMVAVTAAIVGGTAIQTNAEGSAEASVSATYTSPDWETWSKDNIKSNGAIKFQMDDGSQVYFDAGDFETLFEICK